MRKWEGEAGDRGKTGRRTQEDRAREGIRTGEARGNTPKDDRLMNPWLKSAGAVLWAAADSNKR